MIASSPAVVALKLHLRRWAHARGLRSDRSGYLDSLTDNLWQPLHPDTAVELAASAGGDFAGARPHIHALHSSMALVCNVFDPWRSGALTALAAACGADAACTRMRFEVPHPTAAGGTAPHLDVELDGTGALPTAVESKLLEPYSRAPGVVKAFYTRSRVWRAVCLEPLADVARGIVAGAERFTSLDVNQLLAHLLGLASAYGRDFRLLYLWYDLGDDGAARHRAQVERFATLVGPHVTFDTLTYQQLIARLTPSCDGRAEYASYLRDRYRCSA
jgi:hypothetical protein